MPRVAASASAVEDLRIAPSTAQIVTDTDRPLPHLKRCCVYEKAFPLHTDAAAGSCRQDNDAVAASHGNQTPAEDQTDTYSEGRMKKGLGQVGGSALELLQVVATLSSTTLHRNDSYALSRLVRGAGFVCGGGVSAVSWKRLGGRHFRSCFSVPESNHHRRGREGKKGRRKQGRVQQSLEIGNASAPQQGIFGTPPRATCANTSRSAHWFANLPARWAKWCLIFGRVFRKACKVSVEHLCRVVGAG